MKTLTKLYIIVILFLLLVLPLLSSCQSVDTIIKTQSYTSYYSFNLKQPLYVSYTLYKGGGECNRSNFKFKSTQQFPCLSKTDYSKLIKHDIGHLCNSEDFAFDCKLEELTFRYWNALPQTIKLNRGKWKSLETLTRRLSQDDSLYIICGGVWTEDSIVPTHCWKACWSLTTCELIYCYIYPNTTTPSRTVITINQLEELLKLKLPMYNGMF